MALLLQGLAESELMSTFDDHKDLALDCWGEFNRCWGARDTGAQMRQTGLKAG